MQRDAHNSEFCTLLQHGEVSHKNKQEYVTAMEDITEILDGEHCATKEQGVHSLDPTTSVVEEQSIEIRNTLDMVERLPIDGCSSFSETSTERCPPLYVGDIDISLE